MTKITRRNLASMGVALPLAFLITAAAGQNGPQPEIKWSEAKPIIKEYVEKMSAIYKASTGAEFTPEQKAQLVALLSANMEATNIYAFVDP
jgi:hypothetical protein